MRGGRGLAPARPHRASRLPPRSGSRPPPSVGFSGALASTGFRARARQPVRRYEPAAPDEIVHIGIKKLGRFNRIGHRITGDRAGQSNTRGVGWGIRASGGRRPFASRPTRKSCPTRSEAPCLRFLFNALRFFRSLGVKVERVMTDNGSSFRSRRYAKALRLLRIRHLWIKPYTPKSNGKPKRFVQPACANGPTPAPAALPTCAPPSCLNWLHRYNWHRLMAVLNQSRQPADFP